MKWIQSRVTSFVYINGSRIVALAENVWLMLTCKVPVQAFPTTLTSLRHYPHTI